MDVRLLRSSIHDYSFDLFGARVNMDPRKRQVGGNRRWAIGMEMANGITTSTLNVKTPGANRDHWQVDEKQVAGEGNPALMTPSVSVGREAMRLGDSRILQGGKLDETRGGYANEGYIPAVDVEEWMGVRWPIGRRFGLCEVHWRAESLYDVYARQSVAVGGLEFQPIDYGDTLTIDHDTQYVLGRSDRKEQNQCAILRLSAVFLRATQGRGATVPDNVDMGHFVRRMRMGEMRISKISGRRRSHRPYGEELSRRQVYDALNHGRDRDFG